VERLQAAAGLVGEEHSNNKFMIKKIFILIVVLLVIGLSFLTVYFYKKSVSSDVKKVTDIVENVSRIAIVPSDKPDRVSVVSDLAPLKTMPFFTDAKIGDQVLFYAEARKAYLYRPSVGKIVNIASITFDGSLLDSQ